MPREFNRVDRVADFIKRELSQLLQLEVRDPRVKNANVNAVVVSRDMSHAKVYVTFWGVDSKEESEERVAVLTKAAGFLRSKLAAIGTMRSTPKLHFFYDQSVRTGEYLSDLIDRAVATNANAEDDAVEGGLEDNAASNDTALKP